MGSEVLYNFVMAFNWNKYAWLIAIIAGLVLIAGCIALSRPNTGARVCGLIFGGFAAAWLATAIYNIINAEATNESTRYMFYVIGIVVAIALIIPGFILILTFPPKAEIEESKAKFIERAKKLVETVASGTSTPEQLGEWRRVILSLKVCTTELPEGLLEESWDAFEKFLKKHYPRVSVEEAFDESKNRPKNDYDPRYICVKDLDTKPAATAQLIASGLLFLAGYLYLVIKLGPAIGYILAMPLGLAAGYVASVLVSFTYYLYAYFPLFFRDKELIKNIFLKILLLLLFSASLSMIIFFTALVWHPQKIYRALKIVFQNGR